MEVMADVRAMTVRELAERLSDDAATTARFLDVRTPEEWQLARISGFERLDAEAAGAVEALDPETPLVFLCHHGVRSQAAARHFADRGFRNVWNVVGGIDAWSVEIDADVPRY